MRKKFEFRIKNSVEDYPDTAYKPLLNDNRV